MKRFINTITPEECPMANNKNCGTCMYCDNRRSKLTGFPLDPVDSGEPDHCNYLSGEHVNND